MESTVLLVESSDELTEIVGAQLQPPTWRVEKRQTVDDALGWLETHTPELAVVDVDLVKGWNVCTQIKRAMPDVPVLIVSRRFGRDVFIEHQKLETRADAYHQLPQDRDGLGISLSLYASRRPDANRDRSQSGFRVITRQRLQSSQSRESLGASGLLDRLERTAATQAREIEKLKQHIEALEVERDAVAENARRQVMQLMSLPAGEGAADEKELLHLKKRVAQLESEALSASQRLEAGARAEKDLEALRAEHQGALQRLEQLTLEQAQGRERDDTRVAVLKSGRDAAVAELEGLRREVRAREQSWQAERASLQQQLSALLEADDTVQVSVESFEFSREAARAQASEAAEQLGRASAQLSELAGELAAVDRERTALRQERDSLAAKVAELSQALEAAGPDKAASGQALDEALARAETAESAWSTVNARVDQLTRLLEERQKENDLLSSARRDAEGALMTSRKLMREYASEAGRKAEDLRALEQRARELEAEVEALGKKAEEAARDAEFQRSLVAMLEADVAAAKEAAPPAPDPSQGVALAAAVERADMLETRLVEARAAFASFTRDLEALLVIPVSATETAAVPAASGTSAPMQPPEPPPDEGDEEAEALAAEPPAEAAPPP